MADHTMLERARALGPELRDRSEEIDDLRRLPAVLGSRAPLPPA